MYFIWWYHPICSKIILNKDEQQISQSCLGTRQKKKPFLFFFPFHFFLLKEVHTFLLKPLISLLWIFLTRNLKNEWSLSRYTFSFEKKYLAVSSGYNSVADEQNYPRSSILLKAESTSGVTTARFLSSPKTQQHLSSVLMATTSWANTQSKPGETCTDYTISYILWGIPGVDIPIILSLHKFRYLRKFGSFS